MAFNAYISEVLAPKLEPGDVVILDNLRVHKASHAEPVAAARGGG
jgi:alpha-ketoglutarate-dependent taurine dioxygenase